MTSVQAPAPTITNAGTVPETPRKLFVNIPVADLQRSITFFEALGFRFNPQFTDATATCMLVGTDAYVMLLTRERFATFSRRPTGDPRAATGALFAFSVDSRAEGGRDGRAGGRRRRLARARRAGPWFHVRVELLRSRRAPLGSVLDVHGRTLRRLADRSSWRGVPPAGSRAPGAA
jgi:catechol 2,3-dioxygenase-like lactoylglutathione lyase family enzyme